jgi:sorting nexin-4
MKARPGRGTSLSNASESGGILDSLADTFINTWTKVHKPDKRFIEVRERANKLDEDLSHVEKKIASVAHKQSQLETDYSDLTQQFQKLQALEPGVEQELTQFARSLEEEMLLMKGLREFTDLDYLSSLRDMSSYIDAQKGLLKTREQKQLDFEGLSDYLAKAAAERDSLASERGSSGLGASGFLTRKIEDVRGIDHEQARRDKVRKLELQIEKLTREVEQARVSSEMFDDRTVAEVSEFERIKAVELKDTLGGLADAHLDFFKGTIGTWEKFLEDMQREQAHAEEQNA